MDKVVPAPAALDRPTPARRAGRWLRRGWSSLIQRQELVVFLLLMLFGIALTFSTTTFFTSANLINLTLAFSWYAIAAFGATMVIIVGGIDLSVGSVMALAGIVSALALQSGMSLFAALALSALCGVLVGLINGILVGSTGLPPFMVTLGTMGIIRGIVLSLTSGAPVINLPSAFRSLGQKDLLFGAIAIPLPVVWMSLLALLVSLLLHQTVIGRYIYIVARSERALRGASISPVTLKIVVYTISSLLAVIAGVIMTARIGVAAPMAANGYELDIIAAAVIGGASLFGGQGTVIGVILGAALIQVIRNGVVLLGLTNQNQWQFVMVGTMILVVLLLDHWRRRQV